MLPGHRALCVRDGDRTKNHCLRGETERESHPETSDFKELRGFTGNHFASGEREDARLVE